MPVNGVLPVYIFVPLEPETNPVSVNVTASNVVLSLVALILKSEIKDLKQNKDRIPKDTEKIILDAEKHFKR